MAKNNFRGMPGGMNQAAMMRQAQKMQQDMLRMQQELQEKEYEAKASDPEYGHVYARLADQEREHCMALLGVIGSLGKK